ncbi:hypothetical protein Syun_029825 [Stephania yunnanensis]|uniref:Uncharacterized protein n=1 Tax=Stephania yunnanensis TaxID=152371 RepID=A0AAP0E6C7_9MAGN
MTSDYGKSGENTLNRLGFHIGRDCRIKYGTMSEEVVERGNIQEEDVIIGDEACATATGTFGEREAYPNFTSAFKRNVNMADQAVTSATGTPAEGEAFPDFMDSFILNIQLKSKKEAFT